MEILPSLNDVCVNIHSIASTNWNCMSRLVFSANSFGEESVKHGKVCMDGSIFDAVFSEFSLVDSVFKLVQLHKLVV